MPWDASHEELEDATRSTRVALAMRTSLAGCCITAPGGRCDRSGHGHGHHITDARARHTHTMLVRERAAHLANCTTGVFLPPPSCSPGVGVGVGVGTGAPLARDRDPPIPGKPGPATGCGARSRQRALTLSMARLRQVFFYLPFDRTSGRPRALRHMLRLPRRLLSWNLPGAGARRHALRGPHLLLPPPHGRATRRA